MEDFIGTLYGKLDARQWDGLTKAVEEQGRGAPPELPVNGFNLNTLMRLKAMKDAGKKVFISDEETEDALRLEAELAQYLDDVFSERPEAHIYIIVSCLFLTFVLREPMHPQELTRWIKDEKDGSVRYRCPANNGSLTCSFCVCGRLKET